MAPRRTHKPGVEAHPPRQNHLLSGFPIRTRATSLITSSNSHASRREDQSRSLPPKLEGNSSKTGFNMTYRFSVEHHDMPMLGVRRIWGAAYRKRKPTPFYMTISSVFVALSTVPGKEGHKLIAYFTRTLGEPTIKYRDRRGSYHDLTVE